MRAPRHIEPSRLYIATEDNVIGVVLTRETEGKEHIITYLSRRLLDAETRYTFVESYAYAYIMLAPKYAIIYCLAYEL